MRDIVAGPDASRYLISGSGAPVARPFHLRWLLPAVCRDIPFRWWVVWGLSWPLLAAGVYLMSSSLGWQRAALAVIVAVSLPGVWGPLVARPVGVDLPAMALSACAAGAVVHGWMWVGAVLICVAAHVKESSPVWAALWAWNPILLVGLIPVAFNAAVIKPGMDPVTAKLREIHDHPFRTAIRYRTPIGSPNWPWYRNAWVMLAPWGVCLAALYRPTWQTVAVLVVAHLQLLVATDTARLLHTAAGPALAVAAAQNIPDGWLLVAGALAVFWWYETQVM